jgi:hypothetical protein
MQNQTIQFLDHSTIRAAQRGITEKMIKVTVNFGKVFYRQGLRYFICLEKKLKGKIAPSEIEHYRNTVVILNDSNQIVTCYKSEKAISHIRKKDKWLVKNRR